MKIELITSKLNPKGFCICRIPFGFLMLLISTFCYSQSFSKNNPQIYIKDSTAVYIQDEISVKDHENTSAESNTVEGREYIYVEKGTQIYGLDKIVESEVPKIENQNNSTLTKLKAKPEETISEPERKNSANMHFKALEAPYNFGISSSGHFKSAILNNTVDLKYVFISASFYDLIKIFVIVVSLFWVYCTFPIKREFLAHFSRPPPVLVL